MQEEVPRSMIELVGIHRANDAQFVSNTAQMGNDAGHYLAGFAMAGEGVGRTEQTWLAIFDEGELLSPNIRIRARLAVEFIEFRLVIKEVERGRCPGHV